MKAHSKLTLILAAGMAAFASSLFAQLSIPTDFGSDGALNISANTLIDLSQAVPGNWTNNNSANAGKGIYDSTQWAVVFKYSSVTIASGATLTFANHPTHAPVVWLVSGNVTINGTITLDGVSGNGDPINLPDPGPGGFRGGAEFSGGYGNGTGFGPGGSAYYNGAYNGSYATYPYGSTNILPLIGGSGGSGDNDNGGAGGGAMLIAASGTITLSGSGYCHANGGNGASGGGQGSGGAIRMIAGQILGNGTIQASAPSFNPAQAGRISLEATNVSAALSLDPTTVASSPYPVTIFPATNAPTVQLISVGNLPVPANPTAAMSSSGDDLAIAITSAVTIVLQTSNFPTNGTVNVYVKPRNAQQTILQASFVRGNTTSAMWQVATPLQLNHTVFQARAVLP